MINREKYAFLGGIFEAAGNITEDGKLRVTSKYPDITIKLASIFGGFAGKHLKTMFKWETDDTTILPKILPYICKLKKEALRKIIKEMV